MDWLPGVSCLAHPKICWWKAEIDFYPWQIPEWRKRRPLISPQSCHLTKKLGLTLETTEKKNYLKVFHTFRESNLIRNAEQAGSPNWPPSQHKPMASLKRHHRGYLGRHWRTRTRDPVAGTNSPSPMGASIPLTKEPKPKMAIATARIQCKLLMSSTLIEWVCKTMFLGNNYWSDLRL